MAVNRGPSAIVTYGLLDLSETNEAGGGELWISYGIDHVVMVAHSVPSVRFLRVYPILAFMFWFWHSVYMLSIVMTVPQFCNVEGNTFQMICI